MDNITKLEKIEFHLAKKLEELHLDVANMTYSKCLSCNKSGIDNPEENTYQTTTCCDDLICQFIEAKLLLKGIKINPTGNQNARFAGPEGCVVPPQYRPVCSMHWCKKVINDLSNNDPKLLEEWLIKKNRIHNIYDEFKNTKLSQGKDELIADLAF